MKKLLPKLALALVPFLLYFTVFALFDPYNYFGLQKTTNTNNPISRVQGFLKQPSDNIILGDSRLAHFDEALIAQASGEQYYNLAFGGASLEESLDLFEYAYAQNPNLKHVVLGLSFYTLNNAYGSVSRMATIETQLENPFAYLFNLEYNVNMLTNIANKLSGAADVTEEETRNPLPDDLLDATGAALDYRRDLLLYATQLYGNCAQPGTLGTLSAPQQTALRENGEGALALQNELLSVSPAASKFAVNKKQLDRLLALVATCREKGIALTIVLPPMDQSVRDLVCRPLGIDKQMQNVLTQLTASGATVLDYEWTDTLGFTEAQFYDGFHLDTRTGLPYFTETLFREVA